MTEGQTAARGAGRGGVRAVVLAAVLVVAVMLALPGPAAAGRAHRIHVSLVLPTWRDLYDWPAGHGYAGWHAATSAPAGAYGMQPALGGQYGLWLWPVGGQRYGPAFAEWTFTAP